MSFGTLPTPFVAASLGPLTDFAGSKMPVGKNQLVECIGADFADIKTGKALMLSFKVLDGPNVGQEGSWGLNLWHMGEGAHDEKAKKAREIAEKEFAKVLHCMNLATTPIHGLNVLGGRRVRLDVEIQNSEEGRAKGYTNVTSVYAENGSKPYLPAGAAQPQQAAQGAAWPGAAPAGPPAGGPAPTWPGGAPAQPAQPVYPQGAPPAGGQFPGQFPGQPPAAQPAGFPGQAPQGAAPAGWPGAAAPGGAPPGWPQG